MHLTTKRGVHWCLPDVRTKKKTDYTVMPLGPLPHNTLARKVFLPHRTVKLLLCVTLFSDDGNLNIQYLMQAKS